MPFGEIDRSAFRADSGRLVYPWRPRRCGLRGALGVLSGDDFGGLHELVMEGFDFVLELLGLGRVALCLGPLLLLHSFDELQLDTGNVISYQLCIEFVHWRAVPIWSSR